MLKYPVLGCISRPLNKTHDASHALSRSGHQYHATVPAPLILCAFACSLSLGFATFHMYAEPIWHDLYVTETIKLNI
ncbi:hypothetical protein B0J12DRAFT_607630, partial [Macrophomina phaseolina]